MYTLGSVHSQNSSERNQIELMPLQCLLLEDIPEDCSNITGTENIPTRLAQLYQNLSDKTKEAVNHGRLANFSTEELLEIPLQILYLIPSERFRNVPGNSAAVLVKKYPEDVSVMAKMVAYLQSEEQRKDFMNNLQGTGLSEDVQILMAESLVEWYPDGDRNWTFDRLMLTRKIGSPLLAYIPPDFLYSLSGKGALKFLFHLREWKDMSSDPFPMENMPWTVKRAWAYLMIREEYPVSLKTWGQNELDEYGFILSGATPDELLQIPANESSFSIFHSIKLSKLQARTVFNIVKPGPSSASLEKVLNAALLLTPLDLQKFPINSTDFTLLHSLNFEQGTPSLPTAKQVVELLIVQSVIENKMESENPIKWGESIKHLGRFVYALPESALEHYSSALLPLPVLSAIDSEKLSVKQSQLLIGSSDSTMVLQLKGLLQGIKSSNFSAMEPGTMPEQLLNHLLSNLPSGSVIRSLSVLQKVRAQLGSGKMEAMLLNKNPNQFFDLLSSMEVSIAIKEMKSLFMNAQQKILEMPVKNLPPMLLSVLLSNTREKLATKNLLWTYEEISQTNGVNLALLGMTCNDVTAMENVDILSILGKYNKERKSIHKEFPKNLQYCWLNSLLEFLSMKRTLRQSNIEGLLNILEPLEINAFGGYIFASLPKSVIKEFKSYHILKAIGALSVPELLVAMSGGRPDVYTQIYVEQLLTSNNRLLIIGAHELFTLGNFALFLDFSAINSIKPASFRYFMESLDPRYKTLCAGTRAREAWSRLILRAFGDASGWSAGTLATIGDLLVTMPPDVVDLVPKKSWIEAADTLTEHTSYHILIDWPGEDAPITYLQVCLKYLDGSEHNEYLTSVHKLVRRYLLATQELMNTVVPATELLTHVHKKSDKEKLHELRQASVQFGHDIPKVEILEPDEENVLEKEIVETTTTVSELPTETTFTTPSVEDNVTVDQVPTSTENSSATKIQKREVNPEEGNVQSNSGEVLRDTLKRQKPNIEGRAETNASTERTVSNILPNKERISCDSIKAAGLSASIGLKALDIDFMTPKEKLDCIETLGSMELPTDVRETLWTFIRKEKIQMDWENAGHLLKSISPEEVSMMKLNLSLPSSLDTLAALGNEVTNSTMLLHIWQKFLVDDGEPISWKTETVGAMGHLMCKLSRPLLERILGRETLFVESSSILGRTSGNHCPTVCLKDLARIAMKHTSYGDPSAWAAEDVASLGVIMAGLKADTWLHLNTNKSNNPLVGLQPSAVKCMLPQVFKVLTVDQISSLSPMAAAMVTEQQMTLLSETQISSLKAVLKQIPKIELLPKNTPLEESTDYAEELRANVLLITFLVTMCWLSYWDFI